MEKGWNGLPFKPISDHYHQLFGGKTYKIPLAVVDDCPNRRGYKGMQTCVFCDEWGSAARAESLTLPLREQIEKYHLHIARKYKPKAFLAYFQAYTNTFTKVTALKANFETALSYPFISGFIVGTRPDCLSPAVFDLWNSFNQNKYVGVEIGVQSFFDDDLEFLRRGHTRNDSIKAIQKIAENTKVDLGIHLIFGNPNDSIERMIETAEICNSLPITNVKLHHLHVLKNTPLADIYAEGNFKPIDLNYYSELVRVFLEHLRPDIAIHRLAAFSSRFDELIAPSWTSDKMGAHQAIVDYLRSQQSYQSKSYQAQTEEQQTLKTKLQIQSSPC